ncbi:DUF2225 domain-containing protein [Clostridiales bacterium COT073_COT-073]|nr:DUF2225 domain-containing protein [Clostridiales bacterium COT073_COT-073]
MKEQQTLPVWLFQKEMNCPACGRQFMDSYPRYSRLRIDYVEPDLRPCYVSGINPFSYDVTVCFNCGYAMLTDCFTEMNEWQRERVRKTIMPKFHSRHYPMILTEEQAEEKYKLAHLSAQVMGLKDSEMGYLMLRTAWFYKTQPEPKEIQCNQEAGLNETVLKYYQNALPLLEKAYVTEKFPIRGMNELTLAYLIGVLHYRLQNYEETNKWLKVCYANREITKKENSRIFEKISALRKVWKNDAVARQTQAEAEELEHLEAEALSEK